MKVAIVDNDPSVQKALGRLLALEGFETQSFISGARFLDALPEYSPDCVVLDLHMPGMSGRDVQRALAKEHFPIPIIFVTSSDDAMVASCVIGKGAIACLTKPVDSGLLVKLIQRALVRDGALLGPS